MTDEQIRIMELREENLQLRARIKEIKRLRAALQQIIGRYELEEEGWPAAEDMREIACRALENKP